MNTTGIPPFMPQFFKAAMLWPSSESELALTARQLRETMDVPFASILATPGSALLSNDTPGESKSVQESNLVKSSASGDSSGGGSAPWIPWIEGKIRQIVDGQAPGIQKMAKTVLIAKDEARRAGAAQAFEYLVLAQIGGFVKSEPGPSRTLGLSGEAPGLTRAGATERRTYQTFGWVAVGLSKAPSVSDETAILAAASHLGQLAVVAQLESMISLRDQFLSIASHELKTPLTSIFGILQLQERMIQKRANAQMPELENFLKIQIRQVKRLNELIDGLLDVSRIQNGRFIVEPMSTDTVPLLREVIASRMNIIAEEAGVRIQIESPEALIAEVDPIRFEEVISNLVMNGIRFSPEGGVVWVRLRQDGNQLKLSIRDQGLSVPPEDRGRIFQPFERAKRSSRLGGLGLGLFISRQIARLHGGDAELTDGANGKGNVVEARFPISQSSAAPGRQTQSA